MPVTSGSRMRVTSAAGVCRLLLGARTVGGDAGEEVKQLRGTDVEFRFKLAKVGRRNVGEGPPSGRFWSVNTPALARLSEWGSAGDANDRDNSLANWVRENGGAAGGGDLLSCSAGAGEGKPPGGMVT